MQNINCARGRVHLHRLREPAADNRSWKLHAASSWPAEQRAPIQSHTKDFCSIANALRALELAMRTYSMIRWNSNILLHVGHTIACSHGRVWLEGPHVAAIMKAFVLVSSAQDINMNASVPRAWPNSVTQRKLQTPSTANEHNIKNTYNQPKRLSICTSHRASTGHNRKSSPRVRSHNTNQHSNPARLQHSHL